MNYSLVMNRQEEKITLRHQYGVVASFRFEMEIFQGREVFKLTSSDGSFVRYPDLFAVIKRFELRYPMIPKGSLEIVESTA